MTACEGFAERAGGVGFGILFVIFWIRERFSASKRPRKIEECVLNFKHCVGGASEYVCMRKKDKKTAHCHVVSDFEDEFPLRGLPFHAVSGLPDRQFKG